MGIRFARDLETVENQHAAYEKMLLTPAMVMYHPAGTVTLRLEVFGGSRAYWGRSMDEKSKANYRRYSEAKPCPRTPR